MDIKKDVLRKFKLTTKEQKEVKVKIDTFLKKLRNLLKKLETESMLGGSSAKGTLVKGDFDCDIFVRFDRKYRDDDISGLLAKAIKPLGANRVHGSRDYFQKKVNGISYEIVPVLAVEYPEEAKNVTDMSPLHVKWISSKLAKNRALSDEIIVAKTFCKARGLYGAESFIGGFSGHVLDILVVYYGSFESLLKNAEQWQKYKVIDVESYGSSDELNKSKVSPLIVIDPVDKNRNAAAALTLEKFQLFRQAAHDYMKKPDISFFKKIPVTPETIKKKAGKNQLIMLKVSPVKGKLDVVGSKLLKIYQHISKHIVKHEFNLIESGWEWDRKTAALLWFVLEPGTLSAERVHTGPPVDAKNAVQRFKKKHEDCYEDNGRYCAKVKRKFTDAQKLVEYLTKDEYVVTRAKRIGNL